MKPVMHKFFIRSLYLDIVSAANIALMKTLRILSTTLNKIFLKSFTERGLLWFTPSYDH